MANSKYSLVSFHEIMDRVDSSIVIEDTQEYNCLGVKWHGKGAFLREKKIGYEIKRKKQWVVKPGDVIYNKLFAWKGSFAILDEASDGFIASDKFPTYNLDLEKVYPEYLKYFFETEQIKKQAENFSKGGASISKFTLNPPDFLNLKIPLPDIDEQKAISLKLNEMFRLLEYATLKNVLLRDLVNELYPSVFNKKMSKYTNEVKLREILYPYKNVINIDDSTTYKQITVKMNNKGAVLRTELKGAEIKQKKQNVVKAGQLIISKIDARNGAIGVIPQELDSAIVSNDFPVFDINSNVINKKFLNHLVSTKEFIERCKFASVGTTNRKRLKVDLFLNLDVVLPSLEEQQEIVQYLENLNTEINNLRRHALQDYRNYIELRSSILDKAFNGELNAKYA